jgi:hypothetical protein
VPKADIGEIGNQSPWMNLTLFRDFLPGAAYRGWEVFQLGHRPSVETALPLRVHAAALRIANDVVSIFASDVQVAQFRLSDISASTPAITRSIAQIIKGAPAFCERNRLKPQTIMGMIPEMTYRAAAPPKASLTNTIEKMGLPKLKVANF